MEFARLFYFASIKQNYLKGRNFSWLTRQTSLTPRSTCNVKKKRILEQHLFPLLLLIRSLLLLFHEDSPRVLFEARVDNDFRSDNFVEATVSAWVAIVCEGPRTTWLERQEEMEVPKRAIKEADLLPQKRRGTITMSFNHFLQVSIDYICPLGHRNDWFNTKPLKYRFHSSSQTCTR